MSVTVVYFSGGLDSTTLAYDVAQHPERYGVSLETGEPLVLLTGAMSDEESEKKRKNLESLVSKIESVTYRRSLEHTVVTVPEGFLSFNPPLRVEEGSIQLNLAAENPNASSTVRGNLRSSYAAGFHLFLAAVAVNRAAVEAVIPHHNPPQAFWGFKFEGPAWDTMGAGGADGSDTSPGFVEALNQVTRFGGSHAGLRFRAPFLDNRLDRYQIMRLAMRIGVPIEETSSCLGGWMKKCGHCRQCLIRYQAINAMKAIDEGE